MADDSRSPFWLLLIQKFAIGRLTAVEVQELADCAIKSQNALGLLALHGSGPQNTHRDVMKKYFSQVKAPSQRLVPTEMKGRNHSGELLPQPAAAPLLLPREWVETLDQWLDCMAI